MGVLQDFFSGNFSGAWEDIVKGVQSLPTPVQAFITKVESDTEGLLMSLAQTAYADVVAGGLSTASFVTAGKAVVAQALTQGKTVLMSDAMVAVNLVASAAGVATAETPTS